MKQSGFSQDVRRTDFENALILSISISFVYLFIGIYQQLIMYSARIIYNEQSWLEAWSVQIWKYIEIVQFLWVFTFEYFTKNLNKPESYTGSVPEVS